ncbi:25132_t:CDS:2, partial [Dentiscutata erythropus]
MPTFGIIYKTTISRSTACRWLKLLGWKYQTHSKKIYFDGHEPSYEGVELNCISPELYPKIVPVTQNETTLYSNDGVKKYWSPWNEYSLRKKSL